MALFFATANKSQPGLALREGGKNNHHHHPPHPPTKKKNQTPKPTQKTKTKTPTILWKGYRVPAEQPLEL